MAFDTPPAFRFGPGIDWNPLTNALDTYSQGMEKANKGETNRLIGDALARKDYAGAQAIAAQRGDLDTNLNLGRYKMAEASHGLQQTRTQQEIDREDQTLPLDLKAKRQTNSSMDLDIQAKRDAAEKELYGRASAIAQMIEAEPDLVRQRDMLNKFYGADPRIKNAIGEKLPKELLDDPIAVARYMRAVHAGYQAPQTMKVGEGDAIVGVSRDPNNPAAPPRIGEVYRNPKSKDPPTGYELDPTKPGTGALRPVAGGPADKITGEQAARTALIVGGVANMPKIRSIFLGTPENGSQPAQPSALGGNMNPMAYARHYTGVGDVGEGQRLMASGMEGVLRALTGAAATKEEVGREVQKYLPLPADNLQTRQRKLDLFENNLRLIANLTAHGTSGTDILKALQTGSLDSMKVQGRVAQPQAQAPNAPKVGEIRKGHVFLGGDPGQEASWAKVQQ